MADLSTTTSGYQTGATDTWTSAVENVTPHAAAHVNGLASAILQIEAVLGSGSTLPGAFSTLAERLAVQVPSNGIILPPGIMVDYGGSSAPTGWLFCDGSAVSRTTYSALFTAIGTAYGSGDGSTTFNVPNRMGRTSVGAGTGSQNGSSGTGAISGGTALTARSVGQWFGAETHLLTLSEIPSHSHTYTTAQGPASQGGGRALGSDNSLNGGSDATNNAGGGSVHNNVQPSLVVNVIIKT